MEGENCCSHSQEMEGIRWCSYSREMEGKSCYSYSQEMEGIRWCSYSRRSARGEINGPGSGHGTNKSRNMTERGFRGPSRTTRSAVWSAVAEALVVGTNKFKGPALIYLKEVTDTIVKPKTCGEAANPVQEKRLIGDRAANEFLHDMFDNDMREKMVEDEPALKALVEVTMPSLQLTEVQGGGEEGQRAACLLYTSPSPRD